MVQENNDPYIGEYEQGFGSLVEEYANADERHINHCQVPMKYLAF